MSLARGIRKGCRPFQLVSQNLGLVKIRYLADRGIGDDDLEVAAAAHHVLCRVHRVDEVDEHLRALMAAATERRGGGASSEIEIHKL